MKNDYNWEPELNRGDATIVPNDSIEIPSWAVVGPERRLLDVPKVLNEELNGFWSVMSDCLKSVTLNMEEGRTLEMCPSSVHWMSPRSLGQPKNTCPPVPIIHRKKLLWSFNSWLIRYRCKFWQTWSKLCILVEKYCYKIHWIRFRDGKNKLWRVNFTVWDGRHLNRSSIHQ